MIGRAGKRVRNSVDHFGDQPHALFLGIQHEGNDIGFSGAQANARAVWPVANLLGNKLHPLLGGTADIRPVLQGLGNG